MLAWRGCVVSGRHGVFISTHNQRSMSGRHWRRSAENAVAALSARARGVEKHLMRSRGSGWPGTTAVRCYKMLEAVKLAASSVTRQSSP